MACQASDKLPIITIRAESLAPIDIGLAIGQQSKKLFPDIERRYDSYLMASLSQMRFNDMLRERLPTLRSTVDDSYQKELEGVASAWSLIYDNKLGDGFLSWDEYWLLNLLPNIGLPANGVGFGVLGSLSKEKSTLIGRNLNLESTPELRSLQAITVYQHKNRAIVNIGFAGIISVLTGFNESGLFVAHFNAASDSSYQNAYRTTKGAENGIRAQGFILRKVLETQTSAKKAIKFMVKNRGGMSSNTLVVDKQSIEVLEYLATGKAAIRHWDSQTRPEKQWTKAAQVAVIDCHVLNDMPNNCRRAKDSYRWERLKSLAVFTETDKAGVQDIARIMRDKSNPYDEIFATTTLQSMIYLPASGHLYLYAAAVDQVANNDVIPSYQVYYQDLIPLTLLNKWRYKADYFWWLAGLLMLLGFALWQVRRSIKKAELRQQRLRANGNLSKHSDDITVK